MRRDRSCHRLAWLLCAAMLCFLLPGASALAEDDHTHRYAVLTVKEATCTDTGYRVLRCMVCGKIEVRELPPMGHDRQNADWEVIMASTCAKEGRAGRRCANCGALEYQPIAKTDAHTFMEVMPAQPATCTASGLTAQQQCSICGLKRGGAEIPPTGHDTAGVEWAVQREPSCAQTGRLIRMCKICGAIAERAELPRGDHLASYLNREESDIVVPGVPPTCTDYGYAPYYQCPLCGETKGGELLAPAHDWGEWQVTAAGSCTEERWEQRACAVCGQTESRSAGLGHQWGENILVQEPDCERAGLTLVTCLVCGEQSNTALPALGHDFGEAFVGQEATCAADGRTIRKCSRCGHAQNVSVIPATGIHSWTTIMPLMPASCTNPGAKSMQQCAVCGLRRGGEMIPAMGHNTNGAAWEIITPATCAREGQVGRRCTRCAEYVEKQTVGVSAYHTDSEGNAIDPRSTEPVEPQVPATCTEAGVTALYQCPTCQETVGGAVIAARGHDWSGWEQVSEGSCTEKGQKQRVCQNCGIQETRASGFAHDWQEDRVEPDCEAAGTAHRVCRSCGLEEDAVLPPLGHDTSGEALTVAATCAADGRISQICGRCGQEVVLVTFSAEVPHMWVIDMAVAPTCTKEGLRIRRCAVCGLQEEVTIPAYGHDTNGAAWEVMREPTCASEGRMRLRCAICGSTVETRDTEKNSYHMWVITLEGKSATCTAEGQKSFQECTLCGAKRGGETVPARGHDWRLTDVTHATCIQDGQVIRTCTVCGARQTETLPAAHAWGEWETVAGQRVRACLLCGETETKPADECPHEEIETERIEPDCVTAGRVTEVCRACGQVLSVTELEPLGHLFSGEQQTIPATCVANGSVLSLCDRCGEAVDTGHVLMGPGPHSWNTVLPAMPAACESAGQTAVMQCVYCGERKGGAEIPALGHDFSGEWTTVTAAICGTDGVSERSCARCGQQETRTLPATGEHTWITESETLAATCTEDGQTAVRTCAVCGLREGGERIPAAHQWGVWINVKIASCAETGLRRRVCDVCGASGEESVAYAHQWQEEVVLTPTCANAGMLERTCSLCEATERETIPPTEQHEYAWDVKEASCAEEGYIRSVCSNCQAVGYEKIEPATGLHSWYTDQMVEPTCTGEGMRTRRCSVCGVMDEGTVIPAYGHSVLGVAWTYRTEPDCVNASEIFRRCRVCGVIAEQMTLEAPGHAWIVTPGSPATCTEAGANEEMECSVCGLRQGGEVIPALGHDITVILLAPVTDTKDGAERRLCSRCDLDKLRILPATGTALTLPPRITEVEAEAFAGTGVRSVAVPSGVTAIGDQAFAGCDQLAAIRMPDSVSDIADSAFTGCDVLWFLCESDNDAAQYARDHGIDYIIE